MKCEIGGLSMIGMIRYDINYKNAVIFAAKELCEYLELAMPGMKIIINKEEVRADWVLTLKVSQNLEAYGLYKPEDADLDDQYAIEIDSAGGSMIGSNERSVLLAAYRYLDLLGFRFLRPGSRYTTIPRLDCTESLACSEARAAALRHRGVCIEGADSFENILEFIDWLPKLGYNSFFLQFKTSYAFLARWYHHELNPGIPTEPFTMEDAEIYGGRMKEELKKRGILLHEAGHGWTSEIIGYPSCEWKETVMRDSSANQLMACIDGKRGLFHGIPINTNLCYSNQQVIDGFVSQVVSYLEEHNTVDYLHVWLADEYNNICECSECQKTTPADQYIHILNQVDRELTKRDYHTKIVFLLYQELLWPPRRETLLNQERFVLMFAPISRTFEQSYEIKEQYGLAPEYVRNQIKLPVDLDENMAFLREWQNVFSGDSFVYDYPLGRAHYGDFGYVHVAKVIGEDIRQLDRMGMNGYISCQELRCFLPNGLPNYVMGHMLFDPSLNYETLEEEYMQAAYGTDWRLAQTYLNTMSKHSSCDYVNGKGMRESKEVEANMKLLVETARQFHLTTQKNKGKIFWKHLDYHTQYSVRLGEALFHLAGGHNEKAQNCWDDFQEFICRNEMEFQGCLDVYRVTEVTAKYTGFALNERLRKTL